MKSYIVSKSSLLLHSFLFVQMSCYACSKRYGFFSKEVGCPNCGFSFCTKCLKKTIEVPKCGNSERKVCLACYEKLSIKKIENKQSLENPIKGKTEQNISVLDAPIPETEMLPDVDDEIKSRLKLIKEPLEPIPVEEGTSALGIGKRLANLKGIPYKEHNNKDIINAIDKRTEQEKTNDLLKQFLGEKEIDDTSSSNASGINGLDSDEDPIKNIERRLAALKGTSTSGTSTFQIPSDANENEDEETMAQKMVKKYLAEAALPDADLTPEEKEFVNSIKPNGDTEELPWCTICNEDAIIRCIGCDGDLFCRPCFKEIHDNDEEYREHQTKQFIQKNKKADEIL